MGGWVGSRDDLDDVEKRKFLILPGLEFRPLSRPVRYGLYGKEKSLAPPRNRTVAIQPVAPRYTDFIYTQVCVCVRAHTPVFVAMANRSDVISELSLTITKVCVCVYIYIHL
jgi:hypothetical protein